MREREMGRRFRTGKESGDRKRGQTAGIQATGKTQWRKHEVEKGI